MFEKSELNLIERVREASMIVGGASTLYHKVEYETWGDDKNKCHGKIGKTLFLGSLLVHFGCEVWELWEENKGKRGKNIENI